MWQRLRTWMSSHHIITPAAVVVGILIAVLVLGLAIRGNGDGPGEMTSPTPMAEDGAAPTAEPTGLCDLPGDEEFTLDYQEHTNGEVIDGGLSADPEAAKAKILEVTKKDPRVLRHLLNDVFAFTFGTDPVPEGTDLTILEHRKEQWLRLCNLFQVVEVSADQLGEALVRNAAMDGEGNVDFPVSEASEDEQVIVISNGEDQARLRTVCGNVISPPGEVVMHPPPGPVPAPVPPTPPPATPPPTPPPGATPTPTPPTVTPTPTPTPRTTPTPTPAPPDFRVLAEGADRELNYENGLIQFRANFRVVVFDGSTTDIAPFTHRWYVDGVFQGSTNPILFWVWPGDHEMYVVVKDKSGRSRESNHVPFHAGSIPPSPDPDFTPTPAPTPVPGGSDDDDDGCTGGCMP